MDWSVYIIIIMYIIVQCMVVMCTCSTCCANHSLEVECKRNTVTIFLFFFQIIYFPSSHGARTGSVSKNQLSTGSLAYQRTWTMSNSLHVYGIHVCVHFDLFGHVVCVAHAQ